MTNHPNQAAFKIADPALIDALAAQVDAGMDKPSWAELAAALGRNSSNVRRSSLGLAEAGFISLDPFKVTPTARALAAVWRGETPAPAAPLASSPTSEPDPVTGVRPVAHNLIHHCPLNPRKTFDPEDLASLASSIAEQGIKQNIILRPHPEKPGAFELVAGERRWRATHLLIERGDAAADYPMPALVEDLTDREVVLIALTENRVRQDPPPMEEAQGIAAYREMRVKEILAEIYKGDPLQKGFTEEEIKSETRMAIGIAMKELSATLGKGERWLQLRMNLVEKLIPELQQALSEERITLAQARAIAGAPEDTQKHALDPMTRGYGGWSTADAIIETLRFKGLPIAEAAFDVADYTGPTMEDPELGTPILTDAAQITTLSMAFIKRREKELKQQGFNFVKVLKEQPYSYAWQDADKDTPAGKCGVLLWIQQLRVCERRVLAPKAKKTNAPIPVEPPKGTEGVTTKLKEETVQPYAKRHWLQAAIAQTAQLRAGIAAAPAKLSMAITIVALMDRDIHSDYSGPRDWMKRRSENGHDRDVPGFPRVAECTAALPGAPTPKGFKINGSSAIVADQAVALDTLLSADESAVAALFTAVIASHAGVWPSFNPGPGVPAPTVRIAEEVAPLMPAFKLTPAWLESFSTAQLRQIARACGIGDKAADMPGKKADAITWILEHADRDHDWAPPEMAFASQAKVDRSVRDMLAGKAVA